MIESEQTSRTWREILREVGLVYFGVLGVIIAFSILAIFVGLVGEMLYAIVAFLFFFVPQRLLEKRGWNFERFGLVLGDLKKGLGWGLAATVLTIPFFVAGYWIWETYFLEREFDFDTDHYLQWPMDMEGEPTNWGQDHSGVWVWSKNDVLKVGMRNAGEANNRVVLRGDRPFRPEVRGTIVLKPVSGEPANADEWIATLTSSRSRGVISVVGPRGISVEVEPVVEGHERWPMYVGPAAESVDEGEWEGDRGTLWILLWIATQFILIALPEEYFYRGYIQTRLNDALRARRANKGLPEESSWLGFTPAIFYTSILFGIGHLIVPVGGVLLANRMSVFFPSLIFGWLRRRTGSITASVIYHACSNLMVLVAAVHFT